MFAKRQIVLWVMLMVSLMSACISTDPSDSVARKKRRAEAQKAEELAEASMHPGRKIMSKNDCKTCHLKTRKNLGPSLNEIAAKYDSTEQNITLLSKKVKLGGTGVWGKQIMNAHPDVPDEDIAQMVSYIVSLDGK